MTKKQYIINRILWALLGIISLTLWFVFGCSNDFFLMAGFFALAGAARSEHIAQRTKKRLQEWEAVVPQRGMKSEYEEHLRDLQHYHRVARFEWISENCILIVLFVAGIVSQLLH